MREKRDCGDCAAKPDQLHSGGCDVERCPKCGGQIISCECFTDETWPEDAARIPWTGIWPGEAECIEFGWYSKFVEGRGWVRCEKADPEAGPDLNRLASFGGEAAWDRKLRRFVLRK